MSWQDTFLQAGSWTDPFLDTEGRSSPHRGTDLARLTLPAWEALEVVDSDPTYSALGHIMLLRAKSDGMLFGVSHCRKGTRAANKKVLQPGEILARAATGPRTLAQSDVNFPGTAWYGAHFHLTMSRTDPFSGSYAVLLDARPRILAAARGESAPSTATDGFVRAPGGERNAPMMPTGKRAERLQAALKARKRYKGPVDGDPQFETMKGVQLTLNHAQLNGPGPHHIVTAIDGKLGGNNAFGIQRYAAKYGDYKGRIDGDPLANSWDGFILGLERP